MNNELMFVIIEMLVDNSSHLLPDLPMEFSIITKNKDQEWIINELYIELFFQSIAEIDFDPSIQEFSISIHIDHLNI
jgi:hypothetical protein